MPQRSNFLAKLRGREWRLVALVLWAAILFGNLGAGLQAAAAPAPDAYVCADHPVEAAPPVQDHQDHAGSPHCPLCFVFSAGLLAPPSGGAVMVLAPSDGWAELQAELSAAPILALSRTGPLPRAPPAFV